MPERLNAIEDADNVFWLELANLKIAASGEIDAARAPVLGHLRQAREVGE